MRYHANAARIALVVASFDAESVRLLPPGPTQHIYVDEKAGWFALGAGEDGVARCATMDRAAEYLGGRVTVDVSAPEVRIVGHYRT